MQLVTEGSDVGGLDRGGVGEGGDDDRGVVRRVLEDLRHAAAERNAHLERKHLS